MQDHNDARVLVHTKGNHGYSGEDRGLRMLRNGLQYLLFNSGPITSTGGEITAFLNPEAPDADPTLQFYCMGALYPAPEGRGAPSVGATLIVNLITPKSRGSMRLRSADPADRPIIDPGWLTREEDVRALVVGIKYLFEVTRTSPFREKVAGILAPAPEDLGDADLIRYVRGVTGTNWHPVGSCRMGPDSDPMAVLDPQLRVRGVEGLRVFDASMMPGIISANINAPVMAIADRGVDLMMGTAVLRPEERSWEIAGPAPA